MVQTGRAMDFIVYILVLLFQLDPVLPECTADNCDPDNCSGNYCSKCLNGFFKHSGNCHNCYLHCRMCNGRCYSCGHYTCPTEICTYDNCPSVQCSSLQNIYCSSCPDGFYKFIDKCYRCPHTNCKCTNNDGCMECLPGKYGISNFCNNNCSGNCTLCADSASCSKCITGTYGQSCQFGCINTCQDGTCDKETGTCLQGCGANQYLNAENVCRNCPNRCSSCTDYYTCTSCNNNPGYEWGSYCQYDCIGCSNSGCSKIDGCSSGCDRNYYQTYHAIRKGNDCINCPSSCENCQSATQCTKCKVGYWGSLCNKTCGNGCTTDACDQSQGCTSGCKYGYYHNRYSNTYTCDECPEHCKICFEPSKCHECEQGYYLKGESTCIACSAQCKNKICNQNNGSCTNGCLGNSTGHRCDKRCFSNCLKCSQFNDSDCAMCEKGFYGSSCEIECSFNCNSENGNQACEKTDGHCAYGCKNGYWGLQCDRSCEEGCMGRICNKTTGECSRGCKATHYGANCKKECSQTCKTPRQEGRVCDIINGSCEGGCVDGFTGPYCNETTPGSTQSSKPDKLYITNTSAITALSVVVGIALLLLTVSVIFNVILLRKWRVSSSHDSDPPPREHELGSTDYEDLNQNNHESSTYSSITRDYDNTNI